MTATYDCIATTTTTSTVTEVTFSSISGSFTDLVLVCSIKPSDNDSGSLICQLNSDTGSNYSSTELYGNGSAAGSTRQSSLGGYFTIARYYALGGSTSELPVFITNFMNYSNTTTFKTMLSRVNNASLGVAAEVDLWRSTSAITSIKVYVGINGFASGSTFTLYGIKAE